MRRKVLTDSSGQADPTPLGDGPVSRVVEKRHAVMLVVRWHRTPGDEEIRGYSSSGQPFPSILLVQVIPRQPVVQRFNLIIGKILQISFQNIKVIDTANIIKYFPEKDKI